MYTVISQQQQLTSLFTLMEQHNTYYLDTEFIRTNTRYPKLGLIQLNVDDNIFIVDPLKLDLTQFWSYIFNAKQNILHSCAEDITLIVNHAQRFDIHNVFDTQIALSFLGYGNSMGYQAALDEFLNVQIYKYESRSDWLARPLSDLQLDYAANDVIHLSDLANEIKLDLAEDGLYDFVVQDSQCFVRNLVHKLPIEQLYLEIARASHTRRELAQLQQLCIWREEISRQYDIPLTFVAKNHELVKIVQHQPTNDRLLAELLEPNSRTKRYSSQILKNMYNLPPAKQWPERLPYPYSPSSEVQEQITQLIQQKAQEIGIQAEVLMRKKWQSEILHFLANPVDEQDLNPYLLGWRYDMITQPLLKLLYNNPNL